MFSKIKVTWEIVLSSMTLYEKVGGNGEEHGHHPEGIVGDSQKGFAIH